jgi:glutathione S-transferase
LFKPVVYVKQYFPFCLKLRIFLLEAGLSEKVELVELIPGTPEDEAARAELEPHFEKLSLPACQIEPGNYIKETDVIISTFADREGIDPDQLPTLKSYTDGPFKNLINLYHENVALKNN